jgi:putative sterol carrier protein
VATTEARPDGGAMRAYVDNISYRDLYERWEKSNWRAMEIDFGQDQKDWQERFSEFERRAALWNYSLFFHGEDSVTDNLSPYIDAAPKEEMTYFLTTQQVDEARHAIFFARFMDEVAGRGSDVRSSLDATYPELTYGFRKTFEYLDRQADSLRKDKSLPNLAASITLYHLIVEATLAQPGQHFIESYLEQRDILPGFRSGMENVSRDEQRHIGFGVKMLSDLVKMDPECRDAVAELLRKISMITVGVFVPPGWDERYVTAFGSTVEEVYVHGMTSLESKLRAAGLPPEELPGPQAFPWELPPEERADRAVKLLKANILGEKLGPPSRDPESVYMLMDTAARTIDTSATPNGGMTIQWEFKDADPWYVRVDNGSTSAKQGQVDNPDVAIRCRFEDWVDVAAGREDPRMAFLKGKVRPKGSVKSLLAMRKLFPS